MNKPEHLTRLLPLLALALLASGCETGPQFRSLVRDTYLIEAVGDTRKQTKDAVTVQELGEAQEVVQPVRVQACRGEHLLFNERKISDSEGERIELVPVYETVDPLQGVYVRRLRITNDTGHTLRLNRVAAVLVDAAGYERDAMDKAALFQNIRAQRPCRSTRGLTETLRRLKLLSSGGADGEGGMRIRPGRQTTVLVAFSGVDRSIIGDWALELIDVPVATNEAGEVARLTSFEFPLEARGYRTVIRQRKEGLLAPWEEIGRTTEEIVP